MFTGAILDNVQTVQGHVVPKSSISKLAYMKADAVGMLATGGTWHPKSLYDELISLLNPFFIIRVGGHRQSIDEFITWAYSVWFNVSNNKGIITIGNEPNLEGWQNDPVGYARFAIEVLRELDRLGVPAAVAAPGDIGSSAASFFWLDFLDAFGKYPDRLCVNLYAHNVNGYADYFRKSCQELYIGEVNTLDIPNRGPFLLESFKKLASVGVKAATIFIAGGYSDGAWDDRYVISAEDCYYLGDHKFEWENSVPLTDSFSDVYKDWGSQGGIDNNFRKHLLGIGLIKPTSEDLKMLALEAGASVTQLRNALSAYDFKE